MKKSSRKSFAKTKLVIFDINFDDQMFSTAAKENDHFKKTIQVIINASLYQNLVILTDNFLHDVIKFCNRIKIKQGWIIACNKTVIYDLRTKTYLAVSYLNDSTINLVIHLASLYTTNLFFYTNKQKIFYLNNLVINEEKINKCSKTSIVKSITALEKKIKNKKVFNAFLTFADGFKISEFFLKIKGYFNECNQDYSHIVNKKSSVEIVDKKTIVFRNQITADDAIWIVANRTNVFAKSNILYYPINHFNMSMYLQCRHHVLDKSLWISPSSEKKHIFCIDKPNTSLTDDFGMTTNSFWKNEK